MREYLNRGKYWDGLNDQTRIASCNGLGPEFLHAWGRKILSWLFAVLNDAVRLHDVGYSFAEKTRVNWHYENDLMRKNMVLLAKTEISWWRWHKRRRFLKYWIPIFYNLVESDKGWQAFLAAKPPNIHGKV